MSAPCKDHRSDSYLLRNGWILQAFVELGKVAWYLECVQMSVCFCEMSSASFARVGYPLVNDEVY